MDSLFQSLFQQTLNSTSGTQILLLAIGAVLTLIASILLAHRNDLGWWALIIGVFTGPLINAMKFDLYSLIYGIPLLGIGIFGLARFSRFKLQGKFTRRVVATKMTVTSWIGLIAGVLLLVAAHFNVFLFNGQFMSATASVWVMYGAEALMYASFIFIARGVRAGWLMLAAASIASVVVYFVVSPMLGMLGLQVFTALAAVYGWFVWRQIPAADESEPVDEEQQKLNAAVAATLDKLNASTKDAGPQS